MFHVWGSHNIAWWGAEYPPSFFSDLVRVSHPRPQGRGTEGRPPGPKMWRIRAGRMVDSILARQPRTGVPHPLRRIGNRNRLNVGVRLAEGSTFEKLTHRKSIAITTDFTTSHPSRQCCSPHRSTFHVVNLGFPLFMPETYQSLGHWCELAVIAVLIGVPVCIW